MFNRIYIYTDAGSFIILSLCAVLLILLAAFIFLIFYGIKKFRKEKRFGSLFVTTVVASVLFYIIIQLCINTLYFESLSQGENKDMEKALMYAKIAAKASIIPRQKGHLYGLVGTLSQGSDKIK